MRYDENQDALVERRPAQNAVLAKRPLAAESGFKVTEIAALTQAHLLSQAGQLI